MPVGPRLLVRRRHARVRIALAGLMAGCATLALTPIDAWMPLVGWAPALALVVSPLLIVLTLQPDLPLRVVMFCVRARAGRRALKLRGWTMR